MENRAARRIHLIVLVVLAFMAGLMMWCAHVSAGEMDINSHGEITRMRSEFTGTTGWYDEKLKHAFTINSGTKVSDFLKMAASAGIAVKKLSEGE